MTAPPKALWLTGTALLAAATIAVGWVLGPGAESHPYPDQPEGVYTASETRSFPDIATMTASSALVVQDTVTATGPGKTVEIDDGSEAVQTNREVTIAVDDVLYNRYGVDEPGTVVMIEGYWEDGVGYTREGTPWVEVGDSGYFYLTAPPPERRDNETYSIIHQYGRVLLGGDQTATVPGHWQQEGPWSAASLGAADVAGFENQIHAAAKAAAEGTVRPKLVTVCEPSDPANEDSEPICWEQ